MKVVCVNAKNRPADFPAHLWIEQDEIYTVVEAQKMAKQNFAIGFKLAEIELPSNIAYDSFLASRFRPATEDDFEALEAVRALLEEVEAGEFVHI